MGPDVFRMLKETYYGKKTQTEWDSDYERTTYLKPHSLNDSQWKTLLAGPYPPNDWRTATHDQVVARIITADAEISWREVCDGFVAGCSGRWPRGRQTLISACFARNLTHHSFEATASNSDICEVCGVAREENWDRSDAVFRLYWGYAWPEGRAEMVVDLEERATSKLPATDAHDRRLFRSLLEAIDSAAAREAPSALEKRIAKAKLLPNADKWKRYGMLSALACAGVLATEKSLCFYDQLPTTSAQWDAGNRANPNPRSDIVMPLAIWRGESGIAWKRVDTLFGSLE